MHIFIITHTYLNDFELIRKVVYIHRNNLNINIEQQAENYLH